MRGLFLVMAVMPLIAACGAIPNSAERAPLRRSTTVYNPNPQVQACLANLGKTNASFTPLPDAYYGAGCSTLGTVRLASLRSDDARLQISNLGAVTCPLAQTFSAWARFGADRAARQILGSPLVRIETMGSYNCRNVAGSDRRSAHATANAIDVSGFELADGHRISVLGNWAAGSDAERRFLTLAFASACKRFGTVLGPGYNPAHRNHLHLELSAKTFCR